MRFKVYYKRKDGEFPTFSGDGRNVFDTPMPFVLAIVEESKRHGRRLVTNGDYYVLRDSSWHPVDLPGLFQYWLEPGAQKVLMGITVSAEEWNDVMRLATNDPDFPPKTGYDFLEVKP